MKDKQKWSFEMWFRKAMADINTNRKFPWFDDEEEMERRKFRKRHIPEEDWNLITPRPDKFDWEYEPTDPYGPMSELNWRSSLVDNQGYEISGSLGKFKNFSEGMTGTGEYSPIDQEVNNAIANRTALLTMKEDGSLIIRSVYNGRVILRTRGSHQLPSIGTDYNKDVTDLIKLKYPILLDPNFLPQMELYFEYVGPKNRHVMPYSESDLIFLHAKERSTHQLASWDDLQQISAIGNLNLVSINEELNNAKNATELKQIIDRMEKEGAWPHEGIVVRTPSGYMSKIKGDDYLAKHRFRNEMTYPRLVAVCEAENIRDTEQLKKYVMETMQLDFETFMGVQDYFNVYLERRQQFDVLWQQYADFVTNWKMEHHITERALPDEKKEFAMAVKTYPNNFVLFSMFDRGLDDPKTKQKLFENIVLAPVKEKDQVVEE